MLSDYDENSLESHGGGDEEAYNSPSEHSGEEAPGAEDEGEVPETRPSAGTEGKVPETRPSAESEGGTSGNRPSAGTEGETSVARPSSRNVSAAPVQGGDVTIHMHSPLRTVDGFQTQYEKLKRKGLLPERLDMSTGVIQKIINSEAEDLKNLSKTLKNYLAVTKAAQPMRFASEPLNLILVHKKEQAQSEVDRVLQGMLFEFVKIHDEIDKSTENEPVILRESGTKLRAAVLDAMKKMDAKFESFMKSNRDVEDRHYKGFGRYKNKTLLKVVLFFLFTLLGVVIDGVCLLVGIPPPRRGPSLYITGFFERVEKAAEELRKK
ncbi:uncharacterized protein PG986_010634 [Apiospora aurea]|uniref:Uncharacterized protein n=1 Tax=Apiospora aurea TaxID=335848 RepID=A0ABR1Q426_9PEZI